MQHEHKAVPISELKFDDDTRTIEGFASVFNNVDSYNDVVLAGAFVKTLRNRKKLPMLWQHDSSQVIGTFTEFEERDKGLYVKGTISKTQRGDEAYTLLKDGAVSGMSIGYYADKYEIDQDKGTRKLLEIKLYEVSLVTFPANERAQVTRVKSVNGTFMTEREFEDFLRDVGGLSQREAKTIVSEGYRVLTGQRDVGTGTLAPQQLAELSALLPRFRITPTL